MIHSKPGIIAGSTHVGYAQAVADLVGQPLIQREIKDFANGEIDVNILETVAGKEVFIIQTSLTGKPNDNIVETLLITDALIRARVESVTLVQLLYPYSRKDRKETEEGKQRPKRCPISAKVIADMYKAAGIHRIVTLHLHAPQIVGFFEKPCLYEDLPVFKVFAEYLEKEGFINGDTIMSGPDIGSAKQVDAAADSLGLFIAIIHKTKKNGKVSVARLNVIGDVKDKNVVVYDDIMDTCGTIIAAGKKYKEAGAKKLIGIITHAVLSKTAVEDLLKSEYEKIIVTDSVPNTKILEHPEKFVVLTTVPMIAGAIANLFNDESLDEIVKHNIKLKSFA